jgi:hypothetical protein
MSEETELAIGQMKVRYHFTQGVAVEVRTPDGGVHRIGPGWLAITEEEYRHLRSPLRWVLPLLSAFVGLAIGLSLVAR